MVDNKSDENKKRLIELIQRINSDCHKLCNYSLGRYLEVSGNIGIFCQSEEEYEIFSRLREQLTEASDNPNQKYFKLNEPIVVSTGGDIPSTSYTHLYIRKFDPTPYGKYLGDVDFILENSEYLDLKEKVLKNMIKDAQIYDRTGWDTIQITNPDINAVTYISTKDFAEKVRVKFDYTSMILKIL